MSSAAGPGSTDCPRAPTAALLRLLEHEIWTLARSFMDAPYAYFGERELQAAFFGQCRNKFGDATPKDVGAPVPLFRHEYNTFWRYKRRPGLPFRERYENEGRAGALDFAILDPEFVTEHELRTVINKDEGRRAALRERVRAGRPAVAVGIEFKMWHVTQSFEPGTSDLADLREGLAADCRKLRWEQPRVAYAIAFSHGAQFDGAATLLEAAGAEFQGDVRLALITRDRTYTRGSWLVTSASCATPRQAVVPSG